ncbi:hypothetical protein ROG8370_01588 [Roseovarius gaetbuli]|uniref:Type I secretion protein n=1 Tax=Roseovarius gaetbuli TaxID=1356575 RepID=A0A1X6Z1V9_9RHOB|nr:type I secretion protein ATPase [Roseovarius gaetbuli]SLN38314.1 hypothetical protein ROG8370_01588 [Roseovarius gaetbuli]
MSMDKVTEIVAHMIGIFHTTLEEERLRDTYDKFKALKAAEPEVNALETVDIKFKATHELKDFNPGLGHSETPTTNSAGFFGNPHFDPTAFYAPGSYPFPIPFADTLPMIFRSLPDAGPASPLLTLEPPSSVVVLSFQQAFLSDDDLLLMGPGEVEFISPSAYLDQLAQYHMIATAIAAPLSAEIILPGDMALVDAITLRDLILTTDASTLSGVSATILLGSEALGMHVNAETVEELPSLEDVMPAFQAAQAAGGEGGDSQARGTDSTEDATPGTEWPDPFEALNPGDSDNNPFEIDPGHAVVAGANTLVNEVSITSAWLDAPLISVMGDVLNLDVIVQVNLLVDHDSGRIGEALNSVAINAASMTFESSVPVPDETEAADLDPEAEPDLGLPSNWAVTRIDGDLISINQISQYTFQTDHDRADITFGSTNTYIALGDNTVVNVAHLSELGFGYDLIICGGNMISVNWISQLNVLIDNDTVTYSGFGPGAVSGGDNLVFNGAMVSGVGIDSYGEMQDNFAAAADHLAAGGLTIDQSVAHDSVFEGVDILRVLYIEGDMTMVNWIEQTNILGDSDQVHLAMDGFEQATGAAVNVTAGSNAVINIASINEFGVDSEVSVGGQVYDDALLYQAELIDTDADPLGVDMPALASEAVAFLSDDMLTPDSGASDAAITPTAPESISSPDMMQTMLA